MARILVVEDEPSIALILTQILTEAGHEVSSAADGNQGLECLRRGPVPDLVILDLLMPGVGGKAVLEEMRSTPALGSIPVILVTGAAPSSRDFPPAGHYQALLAKPFRLDDAQRIVEDCLVRFPRTAQAPADGARPAR